MRIQKVLMTIALALTPVIASAQTTPSPAVPATNGQQPAVAQPDTAPSEYVPKQRNVFDFGLRGTNITGDSARYERFRDLGNGLFLDGFQLSRQTSTDWFLDVQGQHVGRLDQAFYGSVVRPGKVKAQFSWDQTPTLMSRTTQTIFTEQAPNVLTINNDLRAQAQLSSPNLGKLINNYQRQFDLKSRRYTGVASIEIIPTADFTVKATFKRMDRDGSIPYGGSFGHGNFIETIAPVKHQLTSFDGGGEYLHGPVLLRAGYMASLFHNDYTTLTFDNPWRVSDLTTATSRASSSLPPSNSLFSVNGLASVKMAGHSRATAYVSTGLLKDAGDPIMSQTANTMNLSSLLPLPRNTVNGEGRTTSVNLTFSSRPTRYFDFKARYRNYDYNNRTPDFVLPQRVAYDATPGNATYSTLGGIASAPGSVETEPFGITRGTFDLDFNVTPVAGTAAGIGYSRYNEDRTHRTLDATRENIVRVTFDQVANNWFSLRTKFEHGEKRGDVTEEAVLELWGIGEQPGTRQFDIASRDRNRATILGTVNLGSMASVNASIAAGKDDYIESQFGLRDNTNRIYGAGFDIAPTETVSFGLTYAFERYTALSRSRTASPPSGAANLLTYEQYLALTALPATTVQIADASRNWATDSADRVHTLVASAEFLKINNKVDLKFTVDLSRAKTNINYLLGPVALLPGEASVGTSLASPVPLPDNTSNLGRSTVDATYALTEHIGIGVSYWYEQYRVKDFLLDESATPSLAFGPNSTAVLTGYLYRPYTANTVWGRMIYRW